MFAGLLEVDDRVAQFLHLAPIRQVEMRGHDEHRRDARVGLGALQRVDIAADGGRAAAAGDLAQHIGRRRFHERAADTQQQRGVLGYERTAQHEHASGDGADDGHRDEDRKQNDEKSQHAPLRHSPILLTAPTLPC